MIAFRARHNSSGVPNITAGPNRVIRAICNESSSWVQCEGITMYLAEAGRIMRELGDIVWYKCGRVMMRQPSGGRQI